MASEREDWQRKANQNAAEIENEIKSLKYGHWDSFKRDYKNFWAHVRRINALFKTLKPLLKDDRQKLWEEFSSICEDAKRNIEKSQGSRRLDSKHKSEGILDLIKSAYFQAKGADSREELNKAKDMLDKAMGMMKDGWGGYNIATDLVESALGSEGRLTKEDRECCWSKWREANEATKYRWQELCDRSYRHFRSEAAEALSEASHGDPKEAKRKVKEIQQEMKGIAMTKWQFQEIHNTLNDAWQKASEKLHHIHEDIEKRKEEWHDRMRSHIERWESLIEKNEDVISRIEGQISDCEEMARNARNDDFADKVRGWIEEKYNKIQSIRETNRELEEKIRSAKSKLGD